MQYPGRFTLKVLITGFNQKKKKMSTYGFCSHSVLWICSFQNNYSHQSQTGEPRQTHQREGQGTLVMLMPPLHQYNLSRTRNVMGDLHISQLYSRLATQVNSHAFTTAITSPWLLPQSHSPAPPQNEKQLVLSEFQVQLRKEQDAKRKAKTSQNSPGAQDGRRPLSLIIHSL